MEITLQDYVVQHAVRGPCTCGQCADQEADAKDKQPTGHTADLGFFKVSARQEPERCELTRLILAHKGDTELDIFDGTPHDFVEIGAWIGDQGLAMMLMGLGELVGAWKIMSMPNHGPLIFVEPRGTVLYGGNMTPDGAIVRKASIQNNVAIYSDLSPEPSQAVYNHSPDGFQWGYGGSGPAQLALAILLDMGVPKEKALHSYQEFKRDFIARLPEKEWTLHTTKIEAWLIAKEIPLPI